MRHTARHIQGLPYRAINTLLSLRLEHDTVHLSEMAIRHVRERHPDDWKTCLASMEIVIATPDFIGQSPLHPENFVLVKRIGESVVLVALSTIQNEYGKYPVQSSYLLDHNAFRHRVRKGHLKPLK